MASWQQRDTTERNWKRKERSCKKFIERKGDVHDKVIQVAEDNRNASVHNLRSTCNLNANASLPIRMQIIKQLPCTSLAMEDDSKI
jgi:hypothetical protein